MDHSEITKARELNDRRKILVHQEEVLSEEALDALLLNDIDTARDKAHQWAGIKKELGEWPTDDGS